MKMAYWHTASSLVWAGDAVFYDSLNVIVTAHTKMVSGLLTSLIYFIL